MTHDTATKHPPILATEFLESLGYKITDRGIKNKKKRLQILEVERIHDGSVAEFTFVANLAGTVGLVSPYRLEYYLETIVLEDEDE